MNLDETQKAAVLKKLDSLEKLEGAMSAQAATMISQLVRVQTELGEVSYFLLRLHVLGL